MHCMLMTCGVLLFCFVWHCCFPCPCRSTHRMHGYCFHHACAACCDKDALVRSRALSLLTACAGQLLHSLALAATATTTTSGASAGASVGVSPPFFSDLLYDRREHLLLKYDI